ncbi:CHAT domain-containing protein [Solwaraspora sp. WMMD406]|uniref:CHAT domain-containing protein n=1 Tax=Solwaraspora sp. WMMD406 TaxID=3016095 RepID=UPI0024179030|nr:CHAT domain-containing protein [Solwaraspora sp. WMMD406]MDG4765910.1 CHAT domain-containing protein [Solwaraspora sp. WMMD406]
MTTDRTAAPDRHTATGHRLDTTGKARDMLDAHHIAQRWDQWCELPDEDPEADGILAELVGHADAWATMPPGDDRDIVAYCVGLALVETGGDDNLRAAVAPLASVVWLPEADPESLVPAAMRLVYAIVVTGEPTGGPDLRATVHRAADLVTPADRWQVWLTATTMCQQQHSVDARRELRDAALEFSTTGLAESPPDEDVQIELQFRRLTTALSAADHAERVLARPAILTEAYQLWRTTAPGPARDQLAAVLAMAAHVVADSGWRPIPPPVLRDLHDAGERAPGLPPSVRLYLTGTRGLLEAMGTIPAGPSPYAAPQDLRRALTETDATASHEAAAEAAGAETAGSDTARVDAAGTEGAETDAADAAGALDASTASMAALGEQAIPALLMAKAHQTGDLGAVESALGTLATGGADPGVRRLAELLRSVDPDVADARHVHALIDAIDTLATSTDDPRTRELFGMALPAVTALRTGDVPAPASGGSGPLPPPLRLMTQLMPAVAAQRDSETDERTLRRLIADTGQVAAAPAAGTQIHGYAAELLAELWRALADATHRRDDLDQAVQAARTAAEAAGGPANIHWRAATRRLAALLRTRDGGRGADRRQARELHLASLRGDAWQVMLQSGSAHAVRAAGSAAAAATRTAALCVRDRAFDDAVRALDAGRGLVVYAATAGRSVPDQLRAAGRADLADEWQAAGGPAAGLAAGGPATETATAVGGDVPAGDGNGSGDDGLSLDDLRHRVLDVLSAPADTRQRLLDPPRPAEIQATLDHADLDAIAYLLPGAPTTGGVILLVGVGRQTEVVRCPGLIEHPLIAAYRQAAHHRQRPDRAADAIRQWRTALGALCDWAGPAGMRPLVQHLAGWDLGRPARVALAPMGPLGVVPWHAARDPATGRYAVQDLQVSYLPSARLLASVTHPDGADPATSATSADPATGPTGEVLIVGDPDGSLSAAADEAALIRATFYPYGRHLAADATTERLRRWLTADTGRSVLHLSCHGFAHTDQPWRSRVVLADGQELTAGDLLDIGRRQRQLVDLVLLAACETGVPGDDHDEVFSLATAFLAAGARSVIATMWRVPDRPTAMLTFMVHHFLREEGLTPAAALRAAQLWMLDPHRLPPATMPAPLRDRVGSATLDDPASWASFTHAGR